MPAKRIGQNTRSLRQQAHNIQTGLASALILFQMAAFFFIFIVAQVQAQTPRSAKDYLKRGIARYNEGALEEAIADFTEAIHINSRSKNRFDKNDRIENESIKSDGLRKLASDESDHGFLQEQVVIVDSFNAVAYYNRGIAFYAMGDIDKAIADFDKAIKINPRYADAHIRRGNARQATGDLKGARANYDRAIILNPNSAFAYNNRGVIRQAAEDMEGAISDFSKAIALNPRLAEAYSNRGAARCATGEMDAALVDLDIAISLNPRNAGAYNNRGKAQQARGDLSRAIADFDRAIELDPNRAMAYANRGLAKLLQGRLAEADQDFKKCFALDPTMKPDLERLIRESKSGSLKSPAPPADVRPRSPGLMPGNVSVIPQNILQP